QWRAPRGDRIWQPPVGLPRGVGDGLRRSGGWTATAVAGGCDRAREGQFHGVDRILGMSVRSGLGYGLFGSTHGWGGWGGSIVMVEPDDRMAVAYVTNQMREPADDNR